MVAETSEKFVPQPSRDEIIKDLILALRKFREHVRWKDFHRQKQEEQDRRLNSLKKKKKKKKQENSGNSDNQQQEETEDLLDQYEEQRGLKTGTKPEKVNLSAPRASEEVEAFLTKLMKTLLDRAEKIKTYETEDLRSVAIKELQKSLQQDDRVAVVPTDKTNSFRVVLVEDYIKWINQHLREECQSDTQRQTGHSSQTRQKNFSEKKRHILSSKEAKFIDQSLDSKAVPSPKLLIKDHKEPDSNGNYPTRLVVPATNFTAAFPKVGYLGIKKILDDNGSNTQ